MGRAFVLKKESNIAVMLVHIHFNSIFVSSTLLVIKTLIQNLKVDIPRNSRFYIYVTFTHFFRRKTRPRKHVFLKRVDPNQIDKEDVKVSYKWKSSQD